MGDKRIHPNSIYHLLHAVSTSSSIWLVTQGHIDHMVQYNPLGNGNAFSISTDIDT